MSPERQISQALSTYADEAGTYQPVVTAAGQSSRDIRRSARSHSGVIAGLAVVAIIAMIPFLVHRLASDEPSAPPVSDPAPSAAGSAASDPSASDLVRRAAEVGIRLAPATQAQARAARVGAADAARAATDGTNVSPADTVSDLYIVTMTSYSGNPATVAPTLTDRLAWVVTLPPRRVQSHGGYGSTPASGSSTPIVVVDARTGDVLFEAAW